VSADRTQVGLPGDAAEKLVQLREDSPYFDEEADVYRLAVAVGLAMEVPIPERLTEAVITTKFRTTRPDSDAGDELPRLDSADHRLARMVELLYPEAAGQPYRYSQYLATIGITFLHGELVERGRSLSQALAAINEARMGREDGEA
jgi:hypothetical protein